MPRIRAPADGVVVGVLRWSIRLSVVAPQRRAQYKRSCGVAGAVAEEHLRKVHGQYGLAVGLLGLLFGCASIEPGRYGVDRVAIEGASAMSGKVLETCLLTYERQSFELPLGISSPSCDEPPFERGRASLRLWRWPWTDWPTFNHAVLERDVERVIRWYRARGYYDARVLRVEVLPQRAVTSPTCDAAHEDCRVTVTVSVEEGEPVRVSEVRWQGTDALSDVLRARLQATSALRLGERFDELDHDATKQAARRVLRESGFAAARVGAEVQVKTQQRTATVTYRIDGGRVHRFGRLSIDGHGELPLAPLEAASGIRSGARYDPRLVEEAQREVQNIGGFSAVTVEEVIDETSGEVHLKLQVTRPEKHELRLGVGVTSGTLRRGEDSATESVPQWDVHLLARYAQNHALNTLGGFRIEERPRLIFNAAFPRAEHPAWGNVLDVRLHQSGLLEARTRWVLGATWDYGPDPFLGFRRSDIVTRLNAKRAFWSRRARLQLGLQQDFYRVPQQDNPTIEGADPPSSYEISFLIQQIVLDWRDRSARPRSGVYLELAANEAPRWAASDWTLFLLRPEVRGYLPLPLDMVLAGRFALARTFITDANPELDDTSQRLGPSVYRLRGGGATSVRGFLPGQLGVGIEGGTHRWELMFEARVPLGSLVELAGLFDAGDVSIGRFRWGHWNASAGLGIRVHSPLGALRLDGALRVLGLQRADGTRPALEEGATIGWLGHPGAIHFTLGESF